jgi:regulator of sigma E protease
VDSQPNVRNNQPMNPAATPSVWSTWFKQNGTQLLTAVAVIAAVCYFLNPLDVLLVGFGLGGIIFIHELGHFLAAKLCNVYVRTFSIGFGPAWPFCQFKYGETNYKLGMVPLGGYVAMAGESTGEVDRDEAANAHEDDNDPRSFKNKPVWQRMIIISAGVVMNIILAAICFIAAYMNGVKEMPAVLQGIEPGSAAWTAGIQPGARVTQLNGINGPYFADIPPEVSSTSHGEKVHIETLYKGISSSHDVEPQRTEGALYPQLGLAYPQGVQLFSSRRDNAPPFDVDSPAHKANEAAKAAGTPLILPGDTLVGMSDPNQPNTITPLVADWNSLPGHQFDFRRRLIALAGQPMTLEFKRAEGGETVRVVLPAAFHKDTGLRMKIGKVTSIRTNSAAANAGIQPQKLDGEKELAPGDRIIEVSVPEREGNRTVYAVDPKRTGDGVKLLDPLRLPFDLNRWADRTPANNRLVTVTVLRTVDHAEKPVELKDLTWDDSYRDEMIELNKPGTPVPLGGLGLAYRVTAEVNAVVPDSSAAAAGVLPGDVVKQARYAARSFKKNKTTKDYEPDQKPTPELNWEPVKQQQWAYADVKLQRQPPHEFELKLDRGGQEVQANLTATDDLSWPMPETGLHFQREQQIQVASGVGQALQFGARRTMRAIKNTYQSLYGMVFGRISPLTMSGPITLARTSYIVAGEDVWVLVLFVALISINLAVVNFLPIPVLDGGHMVFLIYEAIRGKQPPLLVQNVLTIAGLVCVLGLMIFTVGLDVWRLIF